MFSCHEGIPAVAKLRFLFEMVLRRHSKKTHSKLQIMSTGLVVDEMLRARLLPSEQITSDACDVVRAVIPQEIERYTRYTDTLSEQLISGMNRQEDTAAKKTARELARWNTQDRKRC